MNLLQNVILPCNRIAVDNALRVTKVLSLPLGDNTTIKGDMEVDGNADCPPPQINPQKKEPEKQSWFWEILTFIIFVVCVGVLAYYGYNWLAGCFGKTPEPVSTPNESFTATNHVEQTNVKRVITITNNGETNVVDVYGQAIFTSPPKLTTDEMIQMLVGIEKIYKEGVSAGCVWTMELHNRGATNIPIDKVMEEAWRQRTK